MIDLIYSVIFGIHGYQVCLLQEDGMALMVVETCTTERQALGRARYLTRVARLNQ